MSTTEASGSAPAGSASAGSRTAVLMVLASCTSLQFGAAVASRLFGTGGPWGVTVLRLVFAALVVGAFTRPRPGRWSRAQWRAVLAYGVSLGVMNGCFYAALARLDLGVAVTIEFLGPLVLAACLSRRLLDLGWVLLALLGVGLLGLDGFTSGTGLDPIGVLFALAAAGCWALYIITGARLGAALPGSSALAVSMGVGAICLLPLGVPGALRLTGSAPLLGLAALTALLSSVVPYTLELAALRRLPRRVFGVLLSLEPAIAALAGWVLLGQHLGALQWLAIAMVVGASIGTMTTARTPTPAAPAS